MATTPTPVKANRVDNSMQPLRTNYNIQPTKYRAPGTAYNKTVKDNGDNNDNENTGNNDNTSNGNTNMK